MVAAPIAFRIGQINALARCLLASPAAYPARPPALIDDQGAAGLAQTGQDGALVERAQNPQNDLILEY